jgi:hypothetical protein
MVKNESNGGTVHDSFVQGHKFLAELIMFPVFVW